MSTKPVQILATSIDTLFDQITERIAKKEGPEKQLSPLETEQLEALLGHNVLVRSLDIIDKKKITLYTTKNGLRQLLEIEGSNREIYKFFPDLNYCCCHSFRFQVLKNLEKYTCKHVLAGRIASCLGLLTKEVVTETNFNYLVKQIKIYH